MKMTAASLKPRGWYQDTQGGSPWYDLPMQLDEVQGATVIMLHPTDARYLRIPMEAFLDRFIPSPASG